MHHCQEEQINDSSNLKTPCKLKSEKAIKEQSYIHYDNKANTRELEREEFNFQEGKAQRVKLILHCQKQQIIDSRRSKNQTALRFSKGFYYQKIADK